MNARNPKTSGQLGHILEFLQERGTSGATTAEVCEYCGTLNAATCVSELRHSGYNVVCKREGISEEGRRIYRYYMV